MDLRCRHGLVGSRDTSDVLKANNVNVRLAQRIDGPCNFLTFAGRPKMAPVSPLREPVMLSADGHGALERKPVLTNTPRDGRFRT